MGTKILVEGSGVLAPQMQEFWRQIGDGSIHRAMFQDFLDHKDPFKLPNLRATGVTLADWLIAREKLHYFFIGQKIVLRDIFAVTGKDLTRTDLMPVFRPAGTTNRIAVRWKKRLRIEVDEEEDVMKYTNSRGGNAPELYLINRSERPDKNTLGDNAKTPDELVALQKEMTQGEVWLDLYGWCDADSLFFAITGKHLDSKTWTWFPSDRLDPDGVARGHWVSGSSEVRLRWNFANYCNGFGGARLARRVPRKS